MALEETTEAPENQDEPQEVEQAEGASEGTSTEDADYQSPVNLEDVPEQYREYVANYEKQFKSDYTRKTQQLAEERKKYEDAEDALALYNALDDPEQHRELVKHWVDQLGYTLPDPDPEEEVADTELEEGEAQFRDPRVDELLEKQAQAEQDRQYQEHYTAITEFFDDEVKAVTQEWGRPLEEDEISYIAQVAGANPDDDGFPQVKQAAEALQRLYARNQQQWIESKNAPNFQPGVSGEEEPDLSDRDKRRDHMIRIAQSKLDNNT